MNSHLSVYTQMIPVIVNNGFRYIREWGVQAKCKGDQTQSESVMHPIQAYIFYGPWAKWWPLRKDVSMP